MKKDLNNDFYFTCPIFLLGEILTNKDVALKKVLHYGLYSYSNEISKSYLKNGKKYIEDEELILQFLYCYYREDLPSQVTQFLQHQNLEHIGSDEDYNGFIGEKFHPSEDERDELVDLLNSNNQFYCDVVKHLTFRKAYNTFFKKRNFVADYSIIGEEVESIKPQGSPTFDISTSILLDYMYQDKTEFQIEQLVCFLALKSILGKSISVKSNWQHLLARMLGYKSHKEQPDKLSQRECELIDKYSKTYHRRKIFKVLSNSWYIYFDTTNNKKGFLYGLEKNKEMIYKKEIKKTKVYNDAWKQVIQEQMFNEMRNKLSSNNDTSEPYNFLI